MDNQQKELIRQMRQSGESFGAIAEYLSMPKSTIKSFCHRNGLTQKSNAGNQCEQCGKGIYQKPKRKTNRFCCDACRLAWWNGHRAEVRKRSAITNICPCCGKEFQSYSYEKRKYCSLQCYIKDRFKGDRVDVGRAV